ncbi:AgrD family cyclic lactone autoinducer peptide [Pelotomaculum sp. FP]
MIGYCFILLIKEVIRMKHIKNAVLFSLFTLLVSFASSGVIGPMCANMWYQPKVPSSLLK